MKKILIIVGSTRDNRKALKVAEWVLTESSKYDGNLEFEIADLKEIKLDNYSEPSSPRSSQNYKFEKTRKWSELVDTAQGFIFVTPEYNGYFTGALKDAVDYLYYEWMGKPYAVVGYGSRGAIRAVSQLDNLMMSSFMMERVKEDIGINQVWDAFENGTMKKENITGNLQLVFKELEILEKKKK